MREGRREDEEGRVRLGREGVRTSDLWSWGKLKVIKSEDYSTAKLLKFLREVEGFRPVLNSQALGGRQYTLFTIYFFCPPFLLFCSPFSFISPVFLVPPFIQLTAAAELLLNSYSEEHLHLPFLPLSIQR